jgi:hypothetical protein
MISDPVGATYSVHTYDLERKAAPILFPGNITVRLFSVKPQSMILRPISRALPYAHSHFAPSINNVAPVFGTNPTQSD